MHFHNIKFLLIYILKKKYINLQNEISRFWREKHFVHEILIVFFRKFVFYFFRNFISIKIHIFQESILFKDRYVYFMVLGRLWWRESVLHKFSLSVTSNFVFYPDFTSVRFYRRVLLSCIDSSYYSCNCFFWQGDEFIGYLENRNSHRDGMVVIVKLIMNNFGDELNICRSKHPKLSNHFNSVVICYAAQSVLC